MLGYSIGHIAQGSAYIFMSSYFILFMSECVGMNSIKATTIASIALIVEVFTGIIVGDLSDNSDSPRGRRRPFLILSAILMPVVLLFLYKTVSYSQPLQFIYYLFFCILFRISFSVGEIPNAALGAEITSNYSERIKLRTQARWFSILGNAIGYIMPLVILQICGKDQVAGWRYVGTALGAIYCTSLLIEAYSIKKYDRPNPNEKKRRRLFKSIIANYKEICSMNLMKYLILYKTAFTYAYSLFSVLIIYYFKYCLKLDFQYSIYMFIFSVCVYVITTPIVEKMALRVGKIAQQMSTMLVAAFVGIIVFFACSENIVGGIAYVFAFSVLQSTFWQLSYSIFYDITEVDRLMNDKRRGGNVMSLISIIGTIVTAVVMQWLGILLDVFGYNSNVEIPSQTTITFIKCAFILVPSAFLILGGYVLKKYPLSKNKYNIILEAIEKKEKGETYDEYLDELNGIV